MLASDIIPSLNMGHFFRFFTYNELPYSTTLETYHYRDKLNHNDG